MATKPEPIDDIALCGIVSTLVKSSEEYREERGEHREKAMAYFDGDEDKMAKYIPHDEGRSRVISRDVRGQVRKVLPSILRTILGNDQIVEFTPVGEGDEESAEQATDYVNSIALPEANGRQSIEDAINDAVRLRNGIMKWWQDKRIDVQYSTHEGLDEDALAQLVADDEVEVLAHSERLETIEQQGYQSGAMVPQQVPVHDVRIRRRVTKSSPRIGAVSPETFLIHPDAVRLEDSPLVGEHLRLRRSDLVAMGYDRAKIDTLPAVTSGSSEQEAEEDARRRNKGERDANADAAHAMQEVDFYDLLVRVDQDNDGIAELRRIVFAGGLKPEFILENEEWDEVNYADIVIERRPHQWEGNSISDEMMDIQKVKTVLLRQTLDNLYWQNNQQPIHQEGAITNPDAVLNPQFGKPIIVGQGIDVRAALGFNVVPMVADKSFSMLEYLDGEASDRTGISDASSGMAPDALQNMTAKASSMIEASGIGQTEMMVKCIADSLKPVFRGLLRLIIKHQDKPRIVRLRKEWVQFDPRHWNAEMDAVVNIGLGAGTRERDMMMMQQVIALQKEILASMGPVVGQKFVSVDNLYNGISKLVEAAGLRTVGLYFTKPDPGDVKQAMEAQSQQPSPEQIKADAALALEDKRTEGKVIVEQVKTQGKAQEAQLRAQVDINREQAQLDADLQTQLAEIEASATAQRDKLIADHALKQGDQQVQREGQAVTLQVARENNATRERIAAAGRPASIQQAQASIIGRAFEKNERAGQ